MALKQSFVCLRYIDSHLAVGVVDHEESPSSRMLEYQFNYRSLFSSSSLELESFVRIISVIYEGYRYTSHFLDCACGVPYPHFFRTQVKNLLSSEAICRDQITLKPFSAGPHHPILSRFPSIGEVPGGLPGLISKR